MATLRLENSLVDERYEVHTRLSLGSYAEIYTARDLGHGGRAVILKALNTTLRGDVDDDLERTLVENFQNEAMALDKVRHPNIVRRLGHGTAADLVGVPFHYLILEYLPGGDLQALCTRQPLALAEALYYTGQVAEALAHAHANGVIHRDIKPNNLLLTADRKVVKIADFGVAKIAPQASEEITRVGTEVYAPPEHHPLNFEATVCTLLTPSADVYSLAKTVYTLLTGRSPKRYALRPVTDLPPELADQPWGEALRAILRRATASEVEGRYGEVREFWHDLEGLSELDNDTTRVRPRASVESLPAPPPQPAFGSLDPARPRIVVSVPRAAQTVSAEGSARPEPPEELRRSNGRLEVSIPASRRSARQDLREAKAAPPQPARSSPPPSTLNRWQRTDLFLARHRKIILIIISLAVFVGLLAAVYQTFNRRSLSFMRQDPLEGVNAIVVRDVSLRSQPTQSSDYLGSLRPGAKLRVIKSIGKDPEDWERSWLEVSVVDWNGPPSADTAQGFVYGSFVTRNLRSDEGR